MLEFLKDKFERRLFIGAWIAFACLLMVKIKLAVPEVMKDWPGLITMLQSKPFEDIVGDLLTGLIAAYFFYVLIDLVPKVKREKSAIHTLNLIIASVVDAYENERTFGHFDLISLNDVGILDRSNLSKHWKYLNGLIKKGFTVSDYYKLRCGLACMDSRIHEFRAVLPLATTISPEHVLQWLQLTDRARLFHEEFNNQPVGLDGCFEVQHAFGHPTTGMDESNDRYVEYCQAMRAYAMTLANRMALFLLEVDAWMALPGKSSSLDANP
ncbi:hypothetical protein [Pseudomonas sp. XWY-1]|uniref:hypothetical protein n=1 Tax=Pseudomonas sp. XWY-1 TaxID=2069256 RepID=UPI000CF53981|nr:hypothetical protein [Pseudomonas sp. XWY-1]